MKVIVVTLTLEIEDDAQIQDAIDDISVDLYGAINQVIDVTGSNVGDVNLYEEH